METNHAFRDELLATAPNLRRFALSLCGAIALSATAVALAETLEERQGCIGDAFQFCQSAIPDRDRVFACLQDNRNVISAACYAVIAPYLPTEPQPRSKSMPKGRPL